MMREWGMGGNVKGANLSAQNGLPCLQIGGSCNPSYHMGGAPLCMNMQIL